MNRRFALVAVALLGLQVACSQGPSNDVVFLAPAGQRPTHINRQGETVIPNGRVLRPAGRQITVAPHPYGMALSPDGNTLVTANSGVRPFSLSFIRNIQSDSPQVQQVPPTANTDPDVLNALFMGLAFSVTGDTLYVGGGEDGVVLVFDARKGEKLGTIDLNVPFGGRRYEDSYPGDLTLAPDGRHLLVLDQTNFRLVVLDVRSQKIVAVVPTGRYPFALALDPDKDRAFVANIGMFEYSVIEGYDPDRPDETGLHFPAFGYPSLEAWEGKRVNGQWVPGLGDPNAPESFSVWVVDGVTGSNPHVIAKIKTGIPVGGMINGYPAVGGSCPAAIALTDDKIYVSNSNNDLVTVLDRSTYQRLGDIPIRPWPELATLNGAIPFGLAVSPDQSRVYVALAGINAVGVIDTHRDRLIGLVPVGWFPSKVIVSKDGRTLYVANAKGFGSGPNAGPDFHRGPEGTYVGNLMKGTVSVIKTPSRWALLHMTRVVKRANVVIKRASDFPAERRRNPVPLLPGQKGASPIKHVIYVTKENRTFDEVFGDLEGVNGIPELARFGENRRVESRDGKRVVENVTVMPNHHALARRFAVSDNFYCDSDVSADGHRWMVGTYPGVWVETGTAAAYGGRRRFKLFSSAPGRRAFVGASGAVYPEDYNQAGCLWEHLQRNNVNFFNFGIGFEFAGAEEEREFPFTGVRLPVNYPMPRPLYEHTSRLFATFNTSVPDQFRIDMFEKEFRERWLSGKEPFPQFISMMLPNDHGSGERPEDGYPFFASYQADNDLALGRLVDIISHSPFWKETAIFVTEDDPQSGVDHVDAHRSILLVISPWVKPGYVSHTHASFGSIIKTIELILGLPFLNQYDAMATDLADCFTDTPTLDPYAARPVDKRIFDADKVLRPGTPGFNWKKLRESAELDNPYDAMRWLEQDRPELGDPRFRERQRSDLHFGGAQP